MLDNLQQRSGSSPEERHMDAEAIRNLRSFIAILQDWDRASIADPKTITNRRLVESCFTSPRESDMS